MDSIADKYQVYLLQAPDTIDTPCEWASFGLVQYADDIIANWSDDPDHYHADGTCLVPVPTRLEALVMAASDALGDARRQIELS